MATRMIVNCRRNAKTAWFGHPFGSFMGRLEFDWNTQQRTKEKIKVSFANELNMGTDEFLYVENENEAIFKCLCYVTQQTK